MSKKSIAGMLKWAQKALDNKWVYWYGTCGYACTLNLLNSKTAQYPSHYKSSRRSGYRKDIAEGKICCDCIGLFKSYAWDKDGDVETIGAARLSNEQPDCSATMALNACKIKGHIDIIPEIPGLAVWNESGGHIGLYVGNGEIIEARGFDYDVCRTKVKDREFVTWGIYPYLEYTEEEVALAKATLSGQKAVTTAIINTNEATGLSLWDSPKKNSRVIKVRKNEVVNVLSMTPKDGFYYCGYKGEVGYVDGKYLLFENTEDKDFAIINTNEDAGLSLWDSYKKGKKQIKVKKGEVVDVLSDMPDHGFYYCEYEGVRGYADGQYLDFIARKEKEENTTDEMITAKINTNEDAGLSLWDSYKKAKRQIKVKKGEIVKVLSMKPDHNFYLCEYKGAKGYADGQYLVFDGLSYKEAKINTNGDAGLSLWDSYKKEDGRIKVKKGEVVKVFSIEPDHGFYLCEYNGVQGYADGQYLKF